MYGDRLECKSCGSVFSYVYPDFQGGVLVRCPVCMCCHFFNLTDESVIRFTSDISKANFYKRRDKKTLRLYDELTGKVPSRNKLFPYLYVKNEDDMNMLFPMRKVLLERIKSNYGVCKASIDKSNENRRRRIRVYKKKKFLKVKI